MPHTMLPFVRDPSTSQGINQRTDAVTVATPRPSGASAPLAGVARRKLREWLSSRRQKPPRRFRRQQQSLYLQTAHVGCTSRTGCDPDQLEVHSDVVTMPTGCRSSCHALKRNTDA